MTLTNEDVLKIKELHVSAMKKLTDAMQGTVSQVEGPMANPQAPCLIPSAVWDMTALMNVLNKALGED